MTSGVDTLHLPPLRVGSRGGEVENWQRFLEEENILDQSGRPVIVDGMFGAHTAAATMLWQKLHSISDTGVVTNLERALAAPEGFIPFLEARNFTKAFPPRRHVRSIGAGAIIQRVIVHDMEYGETPQGAEWCAMFFAGPNAPRASAHFCVDSDSIVQCVRETDVAWHAPGANNDGIGIEHAGYAAQSRAEWLDEYSAKELQTSAELVARLCARWDIPIVKLSPDDMKTDPRARGIAGHRDITDAFSAGKGHQDPGPNFPWEAYLDWIRDAFARL